MKRKNQVQQENQSLTANFIKEKLNKRIQRAKNNIWSTLKNVELTNFNYLQFE